MDKTYTVEEVKALLYETLESVIKETRQKTQDLDNNDKYGFELQLTLTISMYISEVMKKLKD